MVQRLLHVICLLPAMAFAGGLSRDAAAQATAPRMLVMPFEASSEPRLYWLGEAASILVTGNLQALGVDVIDRDERVRAFTRLQVPATRSLSHGTIIRIGQLVGASRIVVGTLRLDGEVLVVRARNIRLDTGRLQGEIEERGALGDLFPLLEKIARRIAPSSVAGRPAPPRPAPPLAAFENYVKGLLAESAASQTGYLEKAIGLHGAYDEARLELWHVHSEAEQHEKALAAALAIPESSPAAARAQFAAAVSEIALRRHDAAYERLQALAARGEAPEVWNNLGVVQLRRGSTPQTGRATYWFNKAVQDVHADDDYFFNLGYAYLLEQDVQAAIYWLREAVRRNPSDADAHFVLGAALHEAGHAAEAARERELAGRLSEVYEAWDRKGERERVPKGLERLSAALVPPASRRAEAALVATEQRDQREVSAFHLDRARRFFAAEQDREAIAELRRALYLSPYEPEAHLLLGRLYLRAGRSREAIDALTVAVWSGETIDARVALGEAYLQDRDAVAARREAERALALDPTSVAARKLLDAAAAAAADPPR